MEAATTEELFSKVTSALSANGAAIINVDSGLGGHVVVLDSIDEEGATLRDPYHGWSIKVKIEAFINSAIHKNESGFFSISLLQVSRP
jgi:hypothetical protein